MSSKVEVKKYQDHESMNTTTKKQIKEYEREDTGTITRVRVKKYHQYIDIKRRHNNEQDTSARAKCKFKRKSKLVSEVRRQEYEDTTMNKGVRVKKYRRTRKKGSKMKVQSPKYK